MIELGCVLLTLRLDWWRSLGCAEWPIIMMCFVLGGAGSHPTTHGAVVGTSEGRVVLRGWVLTPQLCNAASLLMWSLVRDSDKPLIKVALEVPQHEMKPRFVNLIVWPTIISPLSRPTGLCYFIAAEGSQENFHCMVFYCILLRFTAAWVKLFSARSLNIGCKWEQIHSLMESLVLIQKLK